MNAEQAVNQILGLVLTWSRRLAMLGLTVFILLTVAKLFGLPAFVAIPSIGWQEFGVFVAGTAYALRG